MKRKFIIDKEIDLNANDFLKTKIYADNLTKLIKNTESDKVFTIGLFGSWGTGKSSIIETTKTDFDQEKVKFITYDAWQYSNDSFRRMLLRKLQEELKFDETDIMKKFYQNESMDVDNKYELSNTKLAYIVGALMLVLIILYFIPLQIDYKAPIYSILTLIGLFITVISGAFHQLKISITKPHLFAPEQFEDCFKQMVAKSLKKYTWIEKVGYVISGDKTIKNLDKIVIIIDNIDRCNNDVAYNLLTDIKTFLGNEKYSIVFVIPVDDEALRKHIVNTRKQAVDEDCDKEKEEFLRKFFNVTIRIKPYGESEIFAFSKAINDRNNLNFNKETLNLASKEYSTNPRRVIQLFNNLSSELNFYEASFSEQYETLICSILILREEFNSFYKQVVQNPKLFIEGSNSSESNEINRFLRITRNVVSDLDYKVLGKILTNTQSIFTELSIEIQDSVTSFDTDKIIEYINSDNNKELLYDFIVDKLEKAIANGLHIEAKDIYDFVAKINLSNPTDAHINTRLIQKLNVHLDYVIENSSSQSNLCLYALNQEKDHSLALKNQILKIVENNNRDTKTWKSLFNTVLMNFQDIKTSKLLSQIYNEQYKIVENHEFSEDQFNFLINENYVDSRIKEIKDLNSESHENIEVFWLFENKKNISTKYYQAYFSQIINLFGDFRGKTKEEIANLLKYLLPFISLIPNSKLDNSKNEIETIYNVLSNRKIPNPSYSNSPQYDQDANFLDECISVNFEIENVIDFIYNIYRITGNTISFNNEVQKLSINHRAILNNKFNDLIEQKFKLISLKDIIFADNSYESPITLKLLEHCLNLKNEKGEYLIIASSAKTKIDSLLDYAKTNNSTVIYQLLERLIEIEEYKQIIIEIVVNKESSYINSLPTNFLELALKSFSKENYNEFKDNFEFLSIVAERGTINQTIYLVPLLRDKLSANSQIDNVLSTISKIKNIKETYKRDLISALQVYLEENKESILDDLKLKIESIVASLKKS
jgi:hypothetical protein